MHTLRSASLPFSPSFYTIICGRYSSPRWPTPARSLVRANGFDVTHEHGNESALDACIPLGFRDDIRRKGRAFLFSVPLTAQSKSPASLPALSPPPIFRKLTATRIVMSKARIGNQITYERNTVQRMTANIAISNSSVFYFLTTLHRLVLALPSASFS